MQCVASKKLQPYVIFVIFIQFWAQFVLAQTLFTLNSSHFISLDHISSKCIALHILCSCALTYDQRENLQIAVCTAVNADHVREAVKYYFALNLSHFTSLDPILPNCIALHILCSCALTYMISVRICRSQHVYCSQCRSRYKPRRISYKAGGQCTALLRDVCSGVIRVGITEGRWCWP